MTASQATALTFPLYRADDETSAYWTNEQSIAGEFARRTGGEVRVFDDPLRLHRFVAELAAAILDGGDPIHEDAEFLASVGIALPAGMCYDPADYPRAIASVVPAVHPAVSAVLTARALGASSRTDLWLAVLNGPGSVTIHPPIPLLEVQIAEGVERLRAHFPGSRVNTIREGGVVLFVVFFGAGEA